VAAILLPIFVDQRFQIVHYLSIAAGRDRAQEDAPGLRGSLTRRQAEALTRSATGIAGERKAMTRTLLITGAAGNIGAKLASHFSGNPDYKLRLLDQKGGPDILAADLSQYDRAWADSFAGVDTVIHLAGEPRGTARWADVIPANVWGTQNVLRAAREAMVRRVIFASTNQVMLGYRFNNVRVTTDMPPKPLSPYGISKLMGEELGRGFSRETGISFIALRIGYFQRGENQPGPWMGIGAWGQGMWLSNRDMMQAMEKAIAAENVPFAILNLSSNNEGMLWDLEHTRETIGYVPQDRHVPIINDELRAEDEAARLARIEPGYWFNEYFTPGEG
jgi:NAD+ dependent glucose-6-phosphate dehydrogenase